MVSKNHRKRSFGCGILPLVPAALLLFAGNALYGQGEKSSHNRDSIRETYKAGKPEIRDPRRIRKAHHWQQWSFEENSYPFPARKSDKWSLGFNFGYPAISGDVKSGKGYSGGISVRKSLGYLFSLRAMAHAGRTTGLNWVKSGGWKLNPSLNGTNDPAADYRNTTYPYVYYNYQTDFTDISLQGVLSVNNINFHHHAPTVGLYLFFGGGYQTYHTTTNVLDETGQPYDYSVIDPDPTRDSRGVILDQLRNLMDDTYETAAEGHLDEETIFSSVINPQGVGGFGVAFKLGKVVEFMIEEKVSLANDDLLDGQRWDESMTLTRGFDLMHYFNATIAFRIGKGGEAAWWDNPMMQPRFEWYDKKNDEIIRDSDEDGVIDLVDQEPETPAGAAVDAKGRTLDTDGDGIPDHLDLEKLSRQGVEVDADGKTMDQDNDNVPNGIDQELQTPAGSVVDVYGRAIIIPEDTGRATQLLQNTILSDDLYLPMIHFDMAKDEIKTDFYPALFRVADLLNKRPEMELWVVGHTDVRNDHFYNENLAMRRAKNVIDFLAGTFGIDRSRLHLDYVGERRTLIKDLPDSQDSKFENLHYLNRRVEFRVYM